MEEIKLKHAPMLVIDKNGKRRWMVKLKDGRQVTKARWMMMNFLHTNYIPKRIHVHHENEISDDDRLDNFKLMLISDHMKHHNQYDHTYGVAYTENKNEHERNRRRLIPRIRTKANANAKQYYQKHKDEPEFQEKIKKRRIIVNIKK